jgi:hypothetical protein
MITSPQLERLWSTALEIWRETNVDQDFVVNDIVLRMLFGACAEQIKLLESRIVGAKEEILDILPEYLLPPQAWAIRPARTVLRVTPTIPQETIDENLEMQHEDQDVIFTPAGSWPIARMRISTIYAQLGRRLYNLTPRLVYGDVSAESVPLQAMPPESVLSNRSLFIGIDIDEDLDLSSFNAVRLFFDWLLPTDRSIPAGWLSAADFYTQGVKTKSQDLFETHFKKQSDLNYVKDLQHNFVFLQWPQSAPAESREQMRFLDELTVEDKPPRFWVEMRIPDLIDDRFILKHLRCCRLNCMPAINRRLKTISAKRVSSQPFRNIVLLDSAEGHFLEVYQIVDEHNKVYQEYQENIKDPRYSYELRHGGLLRYQERDIYQLIEQLNALMTEEYDKMAAFSPDELREQLEELQKIRNRTAKILTSTAGNKSPYFYIRFPRKYMPQTGMAIDVQYWLCDDGSQANNLAAGSINKLYSVRDFMVESAINIIKTSDGKTAFSPAERNALLQMFLFQEGKIVTEKDLRSYCRYYFGDILLDVTVSKKTTYLHPPRRGVASAVELTLKFPQGTDADQIKNLCVPFEKTLAEKVVMGCPVYVRREIAT